MLLRRLIPVELNVNLRVFFLFLLINELSHFFYMKYLVT